MNIVVVAQAENCYAAGFRAIKQLQAQHAILAEAGPVEQARQNDRKPALAVSPVPKLWRTVMQISYAIWHQLLSEGAVKPEAKPTHATDSLVSGSFIAAKMLRHPHPGHTISRCSHCIPSPSACLIQSESRPFTDVLLKGVI